VTTPPEPVALIGFGAPPIMGRAAFDESQHPRDDHGQFTDGDGGGASASELPKSENVRHLMVSAAVRRDPVLAKRADVIEAKTHAEMLRLSEKYPGVKPQVGVLIDDKLGSNSGNPAGANGRYFADDQRIELSAGAQRPEWGNPNHPADMLMEENPWTVNPTVNGTIRHEIGHAVHLQGSKAMQKEWTDLMEKDLSFGSVIKNDHINNAGKIVKGPAWKASPNVASYLSRYAMTNQREMFAEAFAKYTHPRYSQARKPLPSKIANFMKKHLGA
jgi:hypothetical protein